MDLGSETLGHEVWLELTSGTRVIVGRRLPTRIAAGAVANYWIALTRDHPDDWHETLPHSGVVVRGSAVIAIKAQAETKPSRLRGPREGVWL